MMKEQNKPRQLVGRMFAASKYVILISLMLLGPIMVPTPTQAATRHEVGIATSATLLRMKDVDLHKRLRDIKNLGTTWIRIDFSWHAIQPDSPTEYSWDMYDRIVRITGEHQLKILAVLDYTAPWAREPRCVNLVTSEDAAQKCSPRGGEEFGHFAAAVSHRYKGTNVRAWEIWNEPNLSAYWKSAQADNKVFVDPVDYASVANAAAQQIRNHYRDSVIITGGLSPMFEPSYPKGMRQSDYLSQLLPRLKVELFDGVGMHPYCWPVMPGKTAIYNAFYTVDGGRSDLNLRAVMTAAGWGDKEIWGTEYGASTKGLRSQNIPSQNIRPDHVSEAVQAQIIKQGIDEWYDKPNVGPLFVHSDSDEWLIDRKNEGGFGMRRTDGSKKPSYEAFKAAARRVGEW